jgi:obg-like ATPase 1
MPPKKKQAVQKKLKFGRPGNTLKMGIVGLPNVGKSSIFNLLSNLSIPAENYPFCTVEPHEARIIIPDRRFDTLV